MQEHKLRILFCICVTVLLVNVTALQAHENHRWRKLGSEEPKPALNAARAIAQTPATLFSNLLTTVLTSRQGLGAGCTRQQQAQIESAALEVTSQLGLGLDSQLQLPQLEEGNHGNGRLSVGLGASARNAPVPVLSNEENTLVVAGNLGRGKVVVFSGQEFLGSQTRSTLVDNPDVARLLQNAVVWSGDSEQAKALVANERVAAALNDGSNIETTVVEFDPPNGLLVRADWSASAINQYDVLVIQINEWGTLHLSYEDLLDVRAFVEAGGGLLLAGTRSHWEWWIPGLGGHDAFPGNVLLADTGIAYQDILKADVRDARFLSDSADVPELTWCGFINDDPMTSQQTARLATLFNSAQQLKRGKEVKRGLQRLIRDTPALPTPKTSENARLSALVAVDLVAANWPEPHPWASTYPGAVSSASNSRNINQTIDAQWKRRRPLGAYLPPGAKSTVSIDAQFVNQGLKVFVGDDLTKLLDNFWFDAATWQRAPLAQQEIELTEEHTEIGSGLGGPIYLWVPETFPDAEINVQVANVVPMAVYDHLDKNIDEFNINLSSGAPLAILETPGKIALVVPTANAREVSADEVMDFWDGFYDSHVELAQEPEARAYSDHWFFTPQVGVGYANAGGGRLHYPDSVISTALRTASDIDDWDWWVFLHELGHQFQTDNWRGPDTTEVMVNLWSMYTLNFYIKQGGEFETLGYAEFLQADGRPPADIRVLADKGWADANFFERLELYRQLVLEFGWSSIKQVSKSYYDPAFPVSDFMDGDIDGFAVRMSVFAERDLTEYFDKLAYPLSDTARSKIAALGLPSWMPSSL